MVVAAEPGGPVARSLRGAAVAAAPGAAGSGSWGGRCPRLAPHVTGTGPTDGATGRSCLPILWSWWRRARRCSRAGTTRPQSSASFPQPMRARSTTAPISSGAPSSFTSTVGEVDLGFRHIHRFVRDIIGLYWPGSVLHQSPAACSLSGEHRRSSSEPATALESDSGRAIGAARCSGEASASGCAPRRSA